MCSINAYRMISEAEGSLEDGRWEIEGRREAGTLVDFQVPQTASVSAGVFWPVSQPAYTF
jgi:hypothetical protein